METKIIQIECNMSGAVLLAQSDVLDQLDESIAYALDVVLDPDGKSELTCDFDEPWAEVWQREGEPVLALCRNGSMLLGFLPGGWFTILLVDAASDLSHFGTPLSTHHGLLHLPSGQLAIVEAGALVEHLLANTESPMVAEETSVPGGTYYVEALVFPAPVVTSEGDVPFPGDRPLIVFRLGQAGGTLLSTNGDSTPNCFRFRLPPLRDTPRVCKAMVYRIEQGKALLNSFVSPEVMSGYAEVELGRRSVTPCETVRIRLIEKNRGRWRAEWI